MYLPAGFRAIKMIIRWLTKTSRTSRPCHLFGDKIQLGTKIKRERGKGEEEGGSPGELGEGPGVADSERCWGFPEQSYKG